MSSQQIILFDIPSKEPCSSWSPNTWKARLLLNYKGLDYKTEWVEFPDIEPKLKEHVPRNEPEGKGYTLPAVLLHDGRYVMDSRKIADAIEELYPEPSLHLNSTYVAKVDGLMNQTIRLLLPTIWTKVPSRILSSASLDYWIADRTSAAGMPLEQCEQERGGVKAWNAMEPAMREVTALLKENQDGPFFLGSQVSYADFVWASFLSFMKRIGDDVYDEVLGRVGDREVHIKFFEAVGPWLQRNDY